MRVRNQPQQGKKKGCRRRLKTGPGQPSVNATSPRDKYPSLCTPRNSSSQLPLPQGRIWQERAMSTTHTSLLSQQSFTSPKIKLSLGIPVIVSHYVHLSKVTTNILTDSKITCYYGSSLQSSHSNQEQGLQGKIVLTNLFWLKGYTSHAKHLVEIRRSDW